MSFWGMDTDSTREYGKELAQAAHTLDDLLGRLDGTVANVPWRGPDADGLRDAWGSVRSQASRTVVDALTRHAADLDGEITAQDQASASDAEGGSSARDGDPNAPDAEAAATAWRELLGGIYHVKDGAQKVQKGLSWLGHTAHDAISHRVAHASDSVREVRKGLGNLTDMAERAVADGEWPKLTKVIAGAVDTSLDMTNLSIELATGKDLNLASDGTGFADSPKEVTAIGKRPMHPPRDLASIMGNTNATLSAKGAVSMTVVGHPPRGVIVNIPGTQKWNPMAGDNPRDITGNAAQAGPGGQSAASEATADAIKKLYAEKGIPPGTPMMLNGHSQGGMIANSLASNPHFARHYNVTNVMTYGSPVDNYPDHPGIRQLNIQHGNDIVPRLDAEGAAIPLASGRGPGSPPSGETVTLPSPAGAFDVPKNHNENRYQESVAQQLRDPASPVTRYNNDPSMRPFLSDDPSEVTQYTSRLHRNND